MIRSFLWDNTCQRGDKSIALARKCFNKTRSDGVIEQHSTDLANAEVNASLSINVNVVTPDTLPDFVSATFYAMDDVIKTKLKEARTDQADVQRYCSQ